MKSEHVRGLKQIGNVVAKSEDPNMVLELPGTNVRFDVGAQFAVANNQEDGLGTFVNDAAKRFDHPFRRLLRFETPNEDNDLPVFGDGERFACSSRRQCPVEF